jgi:hypothetical protein
MVMKDLVILLLVALILFLIWNGRQGAGYSVDGTPSSSGPSDAPVSPDVTQVIIEQVQKRLPTTYPLETLYIKSRGVNKYDARFMFFNTEGYYGTQYDVSATVGKDGGVQILSQSETAVAGDATNPGYHPDKYQPYEMIEANLDQQLRDALKANKGTPGGLIGTPRELASGASAPAPGPSPSY